MLLDVQATRKTTILWVTVKVKHTHRIVYGAARILISFCVQFLVCVVVCEDRRNSTIKCPKHKRLGVAYSSHYSVFRVILAFIWFIIFFHFEIRFYSFVVTSYWPLLWRKYWQACINVWFMFGCVNANRLKFTTEQRKELVCYNVYISRAYVYTLNIKHTSTSVRMKEKNENEIVTQAEWNKKKDNNRSKR